MSPKYNMAYVGMFTQSMAHREASRCRKFRQEGLVHVEPAIRWWKRSKSFFEFAPLVVQECACKLDAAVAEMLLQQESQPELNAPRVHKFLGRVFSVKLRSSVVRPPGRRLWARARRLLNPSSFIARPLGAASGSSHAEVSKGHLSPGRCCPRQF